ncbi:MAG TPA: hypothetical protein VGM90_20365 [Kofleriaceae bacterium]|jgi:hypothetical protein
MTKPLLLALAVALPAVASANTVATDGVSYSQEPQKIWGGEQRVEGRLGWLIGGADVGDANGWSTGFAGGIGYRVGDATLRGTLDYYRIGDGGGDAQNRHGRALRLGGALRYSLFHSGTDVPIFDLWGEVGLGVEHAMWEPGGVLDRPSAEIAIGYDIDGAGNERSPGRRRHIGYFMAFRTLLAEGPGMAGPAVCGGPCDTPTKPSRVDTTMFFELGMHWGR